MTSTARKTDAMDPKVAEAKLAEPTLVGLGTAPPSDDVADAASLKRVGAQAKSITRSEGKNVASDASARRGASDVVGKNSADKAGHDAASSSKAAATRSVAAAFVAARQKMTPAAGSGATTSVKGAAGMEDAAVPSDKAATDRIAADRKMVRKPDAVVAPTASRPTPEAAPERSATADKTGAPKAAKVPTKQPFKTLEFIVYPAHGVGQIIAIEEQEVAGYKLELFVISFIKDKMILKVPLPKIASVGMRKLADGPVVKRALDTLTGRARVKRTMWSRRAQEYEAKINSGDLVAIAEVVRDLYRSDAQPEQSYSERQLYEAALDRMAREIAAVQGLTDTEALKVIDGQLQKGPRRVKADEGDEADEADATEAGEGGIGEAA